MHTDLLARLIAQKQDVLASLWQLTQRQAALVAQGDLTRLIGLLAAKQALLSQLSDVERQLDPFRTQDPDTRLWRSAEARETAQQGAAACERLLSDMIRVEQECESLLAHRRDAAAERLDGAHRARSARTAYLESALGGTHQLDVSSET